MDKQHQMEMNKDAPEAGAKYRWLEFWDIQGSVEYITSRQFTTVALQFPDELLKEASDVSRALHEQCAANGAQVKVFVMADTTYNSLGVDEVAAQHIHAQCVIHYGHASLSPLSTLPAYFVFTREEMDVERAAKRLARFVDDRQQSERPAAGKYVLVLPDQPLLWAVEGLRSCLAAAAGKAEVRFAVADVAARQLEPAVPAAAASPVRDTQCSCREAAAAAGASQEAAPHSIAASRSADADMEGAAQSIGSSPAVNQDAAKLQNGSGTRRIRAAGLVCSLPEENEPEECLWLWLGDDDAPALTELLMSHSRMDWAVYNPRTDNISEGVPSDISCTLRRRNYLVEKARNANIIGIVVGTLGVAGYLKAAEEVRRLARAAGKRTYTMLMGKPNPAKLANFPEVDVFVMIADAQGQIMDSKEFYAPIITPFEAQMAFALEGSIPRDNYRLDFDSLLEPNAQAASSADGGAAPRFSLVNGIYHAAEAGPSDSTALAEHASRALQVSQGQAGTLAEVNSAAEYLQLRRSYRGLETPYTGAPEKPVIKAVLGRSGRAAHYDDEPGVA